ncbi:MAG TPA: MFS transporter [Actinomycetes bacterium]|nr:MFS transporter [Actinomycetes bacterium]
MREAAWPLIRADLGLGYGQVGLLLGLPGLLSAVVEPSFGVLADAGRRRALLLGGGLAYALSLLLVAGAPSFTLLLAAFTLLYPAAGAFVEMAQATLVDLDPGGQERRMAAWTLAGSVGVVAGPLALSVAVGAGLSWRAPLAGLALAAVALAALAWPLRATASDGDGELGAGVRRALAALRDREVLRWLLLLQLADLAGDVLLGFLALYFVDVVGVGPARAGLAVAVWTGSGLAGDGLLLWVLRRMPGTRWLRASALAVAVLLPAFLLAPGAAAKLPPLALLGLLHAGWYAVPKGRLFAALPGRSGTALAVYSLSSPAGSLLRLALGLLAARVGLGAALWVTLLAPAAVLLLVPGSRPRS